MAQALEDRGQDGASRSRVDIVQHHVEGQLSMRNQAQPRINHCIEGVPESAAPE